MVLVVEIDDLCNCQKEIHSLFVLLHKKEAPYVYVDPGNPISTKPIVCCVLCLICSYAFVHISIADVDDFYWNLMCLLIVNLCQIMKKISFLPTPRI